MASSGSLFLALSVCLSLSSVALGEARSLSPVEKTHPLQVSPLEAPSFGFTEGKAQERERGKKSHTSSTSHLTAFFFLSFFFFFFVVVVALGLHSSMQVLSLWHGLNCPATCRI